jgi:ABC-type phosphate/phosphonate transport system ATPase subunit
LSPQATCEHCGEKLHDQYKGRAPKYCKPAFNGKNCKEEARKLRESKRKQIMIIQNESLISRLKSLTDVDGSIQHELNQIGRINSMQSMRAKVSQ